MRGFHEGHPKEAWALEGLASVHEKCGDLGAALECYHRAAEIRRSLQAKDESKQMFAVVRSSPYPARGHLCFGRS